MSERAKTLRKLHQIEKKLNDSISLLDSLTFDSNDSKVPPDRFNIDLTSCKIKIHLSLVDFNSGLRSRFGYLDLESYK